MKFSPNSEHKRHQLYFDAFLDSINSPTLYCTYITRFINDGAISSFNDDDMQFFKDLLFESKHGKVHIEYYVNILENWLQFAFNQSMFTISKYCDFLIKISELFIKDMFHYIFKMKNCELIIKKLFTYLSPENKILFINVGMDYPQILKLIPKFKTYVLFS